MSGNERVLETNPSKHKPIMNQAPANVKNSKKFWSQVNPNYFRISAIILLFLVWEVLGRNINPVFLAAPSAIFSAFIEMLQTGELITALLYSGKNLIAGFLIAVVLGVSIGLLMGRYKFVEYSLDSIVNALYVTPTIALIPLIVLWFGLGTSAKVFIVIIMAIFPILINTWIGVQKINKNLIDVGIAFCANERQLFNKIIFHATLPFIMAGLRLGIGRAIIGMVIAEFFTAINGLGGMIVKNGNNFHTDKMFVPIILLMIIGIALTELIKYLERKLAPWQADQEE